ncbi:hypothetical protein FHW00_001009 [Ochrobactrum sp. P6BSIII]|nr:hypothetical protein [Ochrobactrum sp. P6BSIII]
MGFDFRYLRSYMRVRGSIGPLTFPPLKEELLMLEIVGSL